MKRGKDDAKIMGPMFPRLHVNDTEKGGPRAPPRNKMALYEQLTIPSQRYNSGAMPPNHNNSNLVPSTSASQRTGRERNMYFPPLASSYEARVRRPEAASLSNQPVQGENKKPSEEDDFMVPIFSQPGNDLCKGKTQNSIDGERHTHLSTNHLEMLPSIGDKEPNQSNNGDLISKQQMKNQGKRNLRVSNDTTSWKDHEESLCALDTANGEGVSDQPLDNSPKEISLRPSPNPHVGCGCKVDNEIDDGIQRIEDYQSPERESIDKYDDVSETSMVDSATGLEVTPDDVVGIIGCKHFWKARTAIANQQRVFAVQVFELHRLIKVQKLIAGSPHLLLEGSAFVGKSSLRGSIVKEYSSERKALANKRMPKDDTCTAADKVEGTAENAVAKAPVPPQNAIQPAGYRHSSVNTASSPPVNMDPKMNPWGFHQPAAHQWLVPVMSPSEGLVYKPYPVFGFMGGPACGGCGPVGPMNPYGMPTHYQQGMGVPPGMHFGGQGYFSPCMPMVSPSMSGSTVEQLGQFSGPNPYGQTGQPTRPSVNLGMQHQSSLNMPSQKNGTFAPVTTPLPPKEGELQGSTARSPSEIAPGMEMPPLTEGSNALPLFPAAPTTKISRFAPPTEKPTRVIRVVPHNPGSSRESAARIFQSIQEERRQYEFN